MLFALARTTSPADVVKEVKRGSSLWIKTKGHSYDDFSWQSGYGMFSIGFSQIPAVREYIATQEEHHRTMSFQDEFRSLLRKYEIEFDERYVWE
jgi:hypothetical protein